MKDTSGTDIAPDGQVWICTACSKRARSRYGFDAAGNSTAISHGWDESCAMHAALFYAEKRDGSYVEVEGSSEQ